MTPATMQRRLLHTTTWVLCACALLAGCALPRMIDSEVHAYAGPAGATQGAGFAFARLPSQQAQPERQDRLEAMAQAALQEAGLHPEAAAQARYRVEVALQIDPISNPYRASQRRRDPVVRPDGSLVLPAPSLLLDLDPPWWRHSVHLVLRSSSGEVAYDTSATFDGPWSDSERLVPVLLRAALRDYPAPPTAVRKVVIELPAHEPTP
ncbi:MAG: hypothetical protein ACT4NV_11610 [Rhodoferax sp.]